MIVDECSVMVLNQLVKSDLIVHILEPDSIQGTSRTSKLSEIQNTKKCLHKL